MAEVFNNPFAIKISGSTDTKENITKPTAGHQDVDRIEDLLNEEDDDGVKVPDKKEEEVETKTKKDEEEDDEESTTKLDDEDEDEDKIEIKESKEEDDEKLDIKESETSVEVPPKKSAILKEYPDFFKKFPFFDKMMFRDKAYTEMFGTFDEAKEIFGKVERLNEFETQLLSGDMRDVLSTVKDTDPRAFDKIIDTFLKQLNEVDKEAYDDVTQNFAKIIIHGMASEAKKKNNKDLADAARLLHEYLFDTDEWQDLKIRVPQSKSSEQEKLDKEREEFLNQRFTVARDGLTVKVNNILKATIGNYIDPKEQMSAYEKKFATQEALNRIHSKVGEDRLFRGQLNRLWKDAASNGFNENSLNRIKKAFLGRANSDRLISTVIKEVRNEVLKDKQPRRETKKDDESERETTSRSSEQRKITNAGRPHQQTTKANERKPGESVEDFFSR